MMKKAKRIFFGLLVFTAFIGPCVFIYQDYAVTVGTALKRSVHTKTDRSHSPILESESRNNETNDQRITNEQWTTVCSNVRSPYPNMTSQSWIPIPGYNYNNFIYSAYFTEILNVYHVVIVGAQSDEVKYICQLWHWNDRSRAVEVKDEVPVKTAVLPEGHGKRYTATVYKCKLSSDQVPLYVSLVKTSCATPTNLMSVKNNNVPENIRNFTICLSPLHNKYNHAYQLVEWIELNRILGADKITVYSQSISDTVTKVLKYYSKRGITEVINWKVPMGSRIHYFGQIVALNDCLYRNKNQSEFVVSLDVDEFIIPHAEGSNTWQDMFGSLNVTADAYEFRNTFFFRKDGDVSNTTSVNEHLVDKYKLQTLQRFQHESYFFVSPKRAKYIARTATVTQTLIHYAITRNRQDVPLSIGFLHHYRNTAKGTGRVKSKDVEVDTVIPDKFGEALIKSVETVWKDIANGPIE